MVAQVQQEGLAEYAEIRYLDSNNARFDRSTGGILTLELEDGTRYDRVNLYPAFPFTIEGCYISVRDDKDQEIGIIKDLSLFNGNMRHLLQEELDCRFFTPNITRIISVKEEFGYSYWDVETDRGRRRFTVRNSRDSVIALTETRILVLDIDGNRFEIPDCRSLDPKSFRYIDNWL